MRFLSKRVKASFLASLCLYNNAPFVRYGYTAHTVNNNANTTEYPIAVEYLDSTREPAVISDTSFNHKQWNEQSINHTSNQPDDISEASKEECSDDDNDDDIVEESTNVPIRPLYLGIPALPGVYNTFERIRSDKMAYVDKTGYLVHFVEKTGMLYRLSRPRRFGKTIFLETLDHLFRGNQNLFTGTKIYGKGNIGNGSWVEHPVVRIDFSSFDKEESGQLYKIILSERLKDIGGWYGINFEYCDICTLIHRLYLHFGKTPVVVLIDEYDSILNEIQKTEGETDATVTINFLNTFFRQIKSCNSQGLIKFAMVIGVCRYSLTSLHSGPNNFEDLTFHPDFSTLFGFTNKEIWEYFGEHIKQFANRAGVVNSTQIMRSLHYWYNGYDFLQKNENLERVFNPVSVINCLREQEFLTYWSSTGHINIIVSAMYNTPNLNPLERNITIKRSSIYNMYDPKFEIPIPHLMLDGGYLTTSHINGNDVILRIPNKEIRYFLKFKLDTFVPTKKCFLDDMKNLIYNLENQLDNVNINATVEILNKLCFPTYQYPLDEAATEREVTRRIIFIFGDIIKYTYCQIEDVYTLPKNFENLDKRSKSVVAAKRMLRKQKNTKTALKKQTKGDLDIVINGKFNYVIENKCGKIEEGISQILRYFMEHFNAIAKVLDDLQIHYILVLNFNRGKNTRITDWVLIPCNNNIIYINDTTASSSELIGTTHTKYIKIKSDIDKFRGRNAGNYQQGDLPSDEG